MITENTLQDRIKEYLDSKYWDTEIEHDEMAKDIVDICEDYFKECMQFEKENIELKNKIMLLENEINHERLKR